MNYLNLSKHLGLYSVHLVDSDSIEQDMRKAPTVPIQTK